MRRILIRFSLIILLQAILPVVHAQPVQAALELMQQGKNNQAYDLLVQLANQGNAVAQYDLGLILDKGIGHEKKPLQARYWLGLAARQGLVQAYNYIQKDAVRPRTGTFSNTTISHTTASSLVTAEQWIRSREPGSYTLQLANSADKKSIEKYYLENNLQGKGGYYRNRRGAETWYALVYGSYASTEAANRAVAELPEELKKWSPWVRKVRDIQRIMLHQ